MSRTFALFVVDNLPQNYQTLLREPNLLVNHPNSDTVLDEIVWCQFGETAETNFGEFVPAAIQTLMSLFLRPTLLDDMLAQQITDILDASSTQAYNSVGVVAVVEEVRLFLEDNKGKKLSYFWF